MSKFADLPEAEQREQAFQYAKEHALQVDYWMSDKAAMARIKDEAAGKPRHLCPRRDEVGNSIFNYPTDDYYRNDGTCSYCGGPSGDDIMAAIKNGAKVGPTDKNYKIYLTGGRFMKAYLQHLSEDQRKEFVRLYNDGTMKMEGRFYCLPFFMGRVADGAAPV